MIGLAIYLHQKEKENSEVRKFIVIEELKKRDFIISDYVFGYVGNLCFAIDNDGMKYCIVDFKESYNKSNFQIQSITISYFKDIIDCKLIEDENEVISASKSPFTDSLVYGSPYMMAKDRQVLKQISSLKLRIILNNISRPHIDIIFYWGEPVDRGNYRIKVGYENAEKWFSIIKIIIHNNQASKFNNSAIVGLERLIEMKNKNQITEMEFIKMKTKLMNQ
jgi:hypothetical protein